MFDSKTLATVTLVLTLSLGCASTSPKPGPKPDPKTPVAKKKPTKVKVAPRRPMTPASFPKRSTTIPTLSGGQGTVLGYVGLKTFSSAVQKAAILGQAVSRRLVSGMIAPMARQMISRAAKLENLDWMDTAQPLYLMMVKGKKDPKEVFVLPIADPVNAIRSARGERANDAEGHAAAFGYGGRTTYLDRVGSYLVVTREKALFDAHKAAIARLIRWRPKGEASLVFPIRTWLRAFQRQFAAAIAELRRDKTIRTSSLGPLVNFMLKVVTQLDRVAFHVDATASTVRLGAEVHPIRGGVFSKFIGRLSGRSPVLGRTIPANAWLWYMAAFDPSESASYRKIGSYGAHMIGEIFKSQFSPKIRTKLSTLTTRLNAQFSPQSAAAVYSDHQFPLAIQTVGMVKDGLLVRKLFTELFQTMGYELARSLAKMKGKTTLKRPKKISLKAVAKLLDRALKPHGIRVKARVVQKKLVHASTLQFRLGKRLAKMVPGEFKKILDAIKGRLELTFATSKNRAAFTFGPHATTRALGLVQGKTFGPGPRVSHAKGTLVAIGVSMTDLLRELMNFRYIARLLSRVGITSANVGKLSLTFSTDGRTLEARAAFPVLALKYLLAF